MTSVPKTAARIAGLFGFLALTSTVALGLPWDIDMADAQSVKAYEWEMIPVPEGAVPQKNPLTPTFFVENYALGSAEGNALTNPVPAGDPAVMMTGRKMYDVYCAPCHGDGQNLGKVATQYPGIAILSGDAAAARLKKINDGQLYLTIRNGKGLMPAYGWAMNDTEMWALVHYLRTMPSSQYIPPAPKADQEAPQ